MDDMRLRPRPLETATMIRELAPAPGSGKGGEAARDRRPFVIAQLGQSLDGRIATASGESKYINGPHALDHLHALRAAVDAVVVGVGTVCADDPLLTVRRVNGVSPARVVIDPSGRVDARARCFASDGVRRLVLRRAEIDTALPAGVEAVAMENESAFAPAGILRRLADLGFARILVEGGPTTLSLFLEAGLVDELHVFVSPVILGAGRVGLSRKACDTLADALRPRAQVHVFADGDVLFRCDLREGVRGTMTGQSPPLRREASPTDDHADELRSLRAAG